MHLTTLRIEKEISNKNRIASHAQEEPEKSLITQRLVIEHSRGANA